MAEAILAADISVIVDADPRIGPLAAHISKLSNVSSDSEERREMLRPTFEGTRLRRFCVCRRAGEYGPIDVARRLGSPCANRL